MKTLVVTGGTGFLGAHVLYRSLPKYRVIATYCTKKINWGGIDWYRIDFREPAGAISALIEEKRPDVVIHTAAMSSVDLCESDRHAAYLINVSATTEIARACADYDVRLIFTSSDMVYDGSRGLYSEEDDTQPLNYYGSTKLEAEAKIRGLCENYLIARVALIYGRSRSGSLSFSESIYKKLEAGGRVTLFADQFRSPIWVDNLADILIALCEHRFSGLLNVGGPDRIDRYTFAKEMVRHTGHSAELLVQASMYDMATPALRPQDVSMDISKLKSVLNIDIVDYKTGLRLSYA